jgi:hypothetical protein
MRRLIFLLACGWPAVAVAQLNGEFQFQFTTNLALWDFTGAYSYSNGAVQIENTFSHSPRGAITGAGTVRYGDGVTHFTANEMARGHVAGSSATTVTLNASAAGDFNGMALGRALSGPFNGSISLALDPDTRSLTGTESGTLCAHGFGCRTIVTNVSFMLPAEMTGQWALTLNLVTSNAIVRGTAAAELSNGRTISFNVRGKRPNAAGEQRLTLVGTGEAKGTALSLMLDGGGALQSLRGKLFGQRLKL